MTLTLSNNLDDLPSDQWDRLVGDYPFMRHGFLQALHHSGCASAQTGWRPLCLTLLRDGVLAGAMLLYLKHHSRGEYVFDHAWADAYRRHGRPYYPKLLCAVPFTPVSGPRLLAHTRDDKLLLAAGAIALAKQNGISSLHILFPNEVDADIFRQTGYMIRQDVQFHWQNTHYASFDSFLESMSKDKRKKVRQDRKRVAQAGVRFECLRGSNITKDALDFFYHCYETTYYEHGNPPYLTRDAIDRIFAALPDDILIIRAMIEASPVACAFNVISGDKMYGRYWGTTTFISGLHFETCYMQSIEYCIEHGITWFEGGAQGEHKMARGLLPVATYSAHWIENPEFGEAIADFLETEGKAVEQYRDTLHAHSPFKAT